MAGKSVGPELMGKKSSPAKDDSDIIRPLRKHGNLIVITGPSGVGKGTVVQRLLDIVPKLTRSVSVTTRSRRPSEISGVDYFFHTQAEFDQMVADGMFMEFAEFAGNNYGTPSSWVMQEVKAGRDVILEIEVQGAKQIKEKFPSAVLIFLSPPSFEALRSRLKGRATEEPIKMALRLRKARQEMRERWLFHYEVINDKVDEAVKNLTNIVYAERCRIRDNEANSPKNEHNKNS
jgi:guanylate kinase